MASRVSNPSSGRVSGTCGNTAAIRSAEGVSMIVSAAAMITFCEPLVSRSTPRRQAVATSRTST